MVTFGRELDRSLLGAPGDKLSTVEKRLVAALKLANKEFASRLFSAPGGFVMLTRLEQTDEIGRPLPGENHWNDVRPGPASATDYLVRLFIAPPGYYRTIAFLFTTQANFSTSNAPVPQLETGGTILPPAVGAVTFKDRNAFALIYSFKKRDTGIAIPFAGPGAEKHLEESGIIDALQKR
jgi:hypothetical protein